MATYKVISDIEAEDKLLGPLTLRQFIYACIVVVSGYIAFRLIFVSWLLVLPLLPIMIFFGLLAFPFTKDQPAEVWLLARLRFFLKPHLRIWSQDGIQELVSVTAPKLPEKQLTKDFSQTEVKSRLRALADTIDSRGWAVKNVNVNLTGQPSAANGASDRLVQATSTPQPVADIDIGASDDMLDEQYNPRAQSLDKLINASGQAHRQQIVQQMKQAPQQTQEPAANYWFMNQPSGQPQPGYNTGKGTVITPGSNDQKPSNQQPTTQEEQALLEKIHKSKQQPQPGSSHIKTIQPIDQNNPNPAQTTQPQPEAPNQANTPQQATNEHPQTSPQKTQPDPALLELAHNDDLNVETIARQANKHNDDDPEEVVVSLH
ncbi:MAG: PrgI family protein [Candidatus Saccharibacteria bacterium]|nr:PrgI family protein [Candidatus Saccharibacteria bacterium]